MDLETIQQIAHHIGILNNEMAGVQASQGLMQIDIAILKTQVAEVMWLMRAVVLGFVGLTIKTLWKRITNNK